MPVRAAMDSTLSRGCLATDLSLGLPAASCGNPVLAFARVQESKRSPVGIFPEATQNPGERQAEASPHGYPFGGRRHRPLRGCGLYSGAQGDGGRAGGRRHEGSQGELFPQECTPQGRVPQGRGRGPRVDHRHGVHPRQRPGRCRRDRRPRTPRRHGLHAEQRCPLGRGRGDPRRPHPVCRRRRRRRRFHRPRHPYRGTRRPVGAAGLHRQPHAHRQHPALSRGREPVAGHGAGGADRDDPRPRRGQPGAGPGAGLRFPRRRLRSAGADGRRPRPGRAGPTGDHHRRGRALGLDQHGRHGTGRPRRRQRGPDPRRPLLQALPGRPPHRLAHRGRGLRLGQ